MDDESPIWPLTRNEILKHVFGYQKLLTAYGFTLLNDWQAAEDTVQETLLIIAGNHDKYDGERPLLPWARGIVRMKCLNKLRSRKKEFVTDDAELLARMLDDNLSDLWDERAATEMAKRIQALRNCMAELPARACRLMNDFYVERKPGKDLAEREKMDHSNLRSHLSRLRKRLRDCVRDKLSEAEAAEKEGYWRLLDDYYGQEGGTASAEARDAVTAILAESGGAERLLDFFIEISAFGICLQELRPLAGGVPRRPQSSGKGFVFPGTAAMGGEGRFTIGPLLVLGKTSDWKAGWSKARIFSAAAALALLAAVGYALSDRGRVADSLVTGIRGDVVFDHPESGLRFPLRKGDRIPPGSKVMVGEGGGARLSFRGGKGASVRVFPNTAMTLGKREAPTSNTIRLFKGSFHAVAEKQGRRSPLAIMTPGAKATVLGTDFLLSGGTLEVDEGLVQMERLSDGKLLNVPGRHRVSVEDMVLQEVPPPDLARGLAGWWAFDGGGDEVVKDSSGNGGDLRIVGAKPVAGVFGGALEFSGRAYAIAESSEALSIPASVSMCAWVKPGGSASQAGVVGKYMGEPDPAGIRKTGRSYSLKLGAGLPEAYISEEGDYFSTKRLTSGKKVSMGEWTHIAVVFEAGVSLMVYINGKLDTMDTTGIPVSLDRNDSPLLIGTAYSLSEGKNFFGGAIDEVRIYSRPLNSGEIRMLSQKE